MLQCMFLPITSTEVEPMGRLSLHDEVIPSPSFLGIRQAVLLQLSSADASCTYAYSVQTCARSNPTCP